MLKYVLTLSIVLLIFITSSFYLFNHNKIMMSLKMQSYSNFYQNVRESSDILISNLQKDAIRNGKPIVPPFVDFDREYAIAPKYNLSICRIKKSMSSLMNGISCILYDTKNFLEKNRTILEVWSRRFCAGKNEYKSINKVKWRMGDAHHTFTKMVVIREPISRFISFFSNKCIYDAQRHPELKLCYDCEGNIKCFLKKQYERFLEHSNGNPNIRASYEDKHSAPLSWNCEFKSYLNEYKIVKLSVDPSERKTGIEEIINILKANNVPESTCNIINKTALEGETVHATFDSDAHDVVKKQIENDPVIRDYLKRIYLLDFIIFDFDYSFLNS